MAEVSQTSRLLDPWIHTNKDNVNFLQTLNILDCSISLKENIYVELPVHNAVFEILSDQDELLFDEVVHAVCETDIVALRRELKIIIQTSREKVIRKFEV